MVQRLNEQRAWSARAIQIPARSGVGAGSCCSGNGFIGLKALGNTDGLEIHAENRGDARVCRARMIQTIDLIEKALELHVIEAFGQIEAFSRADSVLV